MSPKLEDYVLFTWDEGLVDYAKSEAEKEEYADVKLSKDWDQKPLLAAGQHRREALRVCVNKMKKVTMKYDPDNEAWVPPIEDQQDMVSANEHMFVSS